MDNQHGVESHIVAAEFSDFGNPLLDLTFYNQTMARGRSLEGYFKFHRCCCKRYSSSTKNPSFLTYSRVTMRNLITNTGTYQSKLIRLHNIIRGVQYVHWVMHKCIMAKVGGKRNTRKLCKKQVKLSKTGGNLSQ